MERLRRHCFPGAWPSGTSEDRFDRRSTHMVVRASGQLAAYARLTLGPDACFQCWMDERAEIRVGANVVDLARCAVAPGFRSLGLLRLVCPKALILAEDRAFTHVVGAVLPGEPFERLFHVIGLMPSGPTVDEIELSGGRFHVQPLVCDIRRHAHRWTAMRDDLYRRIRTKGHLVHRVA